MPVVAPVVGKKALIVGGVIAYANLYVFMSPSIGTVESLPNPPGNIKEDHSIGSVITALKEKGYT